MWKKLKFYIVFSLLLIVTPLAYSAQDNKTNIKVNSSGYIEVDHGRLFYQKFGSGTPIVIVHGGPGLDQSYLQPQMQELAKHFEVIFYDQRGSGKSLKTKINESYINTHQFVDDLERLRIGLGIKKMVLMGHSWGGFLAMYYAVMHPNQVSRLILLDTAPADFKGQLAFENEFSRRTKPIINEIQPLFNNQDFEKLTAAEIWKLYRTVFSVYFYNPANVDYLTLNASEKSAKSGAKVMNEMIKTWLQPTINLFPYLRKLMVPTLIVHGKQDIIPLWTAQQIKKVIPHAQIIILEKCGHFPYIEQPKQLFGQINAFLADLKTN